MGGDTDFLLLTSGENTYYPVGFFLSYPSVNVERYLIPPHERGNSSFS
jgi:hypothetical protein